MEDEDVTANYLLMELFSFLKHINIKKSSKTYIIFVVTVLPCKEKYFLGIIPIFLHEFFFHDFSQYD